MFFMELGCPSLLIDQTLVEYRYLSFRSIVTRILIRLCNRCPDIRFPHIYSAMMEHGMDAENLLEAVEQTSQTCYQLKGLEVPREFLDESPSVDDVETIVAYFGKSYFNLFLELGFDVTTLDQYDLNFTGVDIKDKLAAITTEWIKDKTYKPTRRQLLQCMRDCDMDFVSLADKLIKLQTTK